MNPDNSLYVHTVCDGASAEGVLLPGDVLLNIDGQDVFRAPAPHVADLLLGPVSNSVCVLAFSLQIRLYMHAIEGEAKSLGRGAEDRVQTLARV